MASERAHKKVGRFIVDDDYRRPLFRPIPDIFPEDDDSSDDNTEEDTTKRPDTFAAFLSSLRGSYEKSLYEGRLWWRSAQNKVKEENISHTDVYIFYAENGVVPTRGLVTSRKHLILEPIRNRQRLNNIRPDPSKLIFPYIKFSTISGSSTPYTAFLSIRVNIGCSVSVLPVPFRYAGDLASEIDLTKPYINQLIMEINTRRKYILLPLYDSASPASFPVDTTKKNSHHSVLSFLFNPYMFGVRLNNGQNYRLSEGQTIEYTDILMWFDRPDCVTGPIVVHSTGNPQKFNISAPFRYASVDQTKYPKYRNSPEYNSAKVNKCPIKTQFPLREGLITLNTTEMDTPLKRHPFTSAYDDVVHGLFGSLFGLLLGFVIFGTVAFVTRRSWYEEYYAELARVDELNAHTSASAEGDHSDDNSNSDRNDKENNRSSDSVKAGKRKHKHHHKHPEPYSKEDVGKEIDKLNEDLEEVTSVSNDTQTRRHERTKKQFGDFGPIAPSQMSGMTRPLQSCSAAGSAEEFLDKDQKPVTLTRTYDVGANTKDSRLGGTTMTGTRGHAKNPRAQSAERAETETGGDTGF